MTTEVNEFLMAGGVPSAKFPVGGKWVKGTVEAMEVRDQTDMDTGKVLTWDNGQPRKQLVVTISTDDRDPEIEEDDGARRIFARGNMLNAIRGAVRPHGGLAIGGVLAVRCTGEGEQKKRGFNAPKLYEARYQPPAQAFTAAAADEPDDSDPF